MVHSPYESVTFGNSLLLRVDGAIGAMSLSPNGRDAVLAGRKGLFIIDLDDPFTTPRWLHHITSWEVADVQWLPHHHVKPSWCISTSNQKALLWDLARPSNNAILNVLHQHNRAITDINFHPSDPELLATCSIDTFIMAWDMRTPRKPVNQWAEWRAGATQVKWNHVNPFEIASSHDNNFYVWDSRKGSLPVYRVNRAHRGKVNGLDFSNGIKNIITCSNDGLIRAWDLSSHKAQTDDFNFFESKILDERSLDPSVVINTDFPVARARPLPFGNDMCVGVMPLRGGNDSVHVVNLESALHEAAVLGVTQNIEFSSVYSFKGHNGPIKDFLWRKRHETYHGFESKNKWKDFQLVSWLSQDYDLKLWPHDEDLYRQVGYNPSYQNMLGGIIDEKDKESYAELDSNSSKVPTPISSATPTATIPPYSYKTYCAEPPMTVADLTTMSGDTLSSLAKFTLLKTSKHANTSQLNHLNWISGVRIGHSINTDGAMDEEDGPTNLGEEVSIVGHKFPKIRFEKISVSTGHLVMSLKGPTPTIESPPVATTAPATGSLVSGAAGANDDDKSKRNDSISNDDTANTSMQPQTSVVEETTLNKLIFIRLEIKFPKSYPFLEHIDGQSLKRKQSFLERHNTIKFTIEDTHELTPSIKAEMLKNLNEIAVFYSNKYNKFCLEHCLRYLLGDKIELSDELMIENANAENDAQVEEMVQEVGREDWADDLINQQPDFNMMHDSLSSEDEDTDLIPQVNDNLLHSANLDRIELASYPVEENGQQSEPIVGFDSTPIPKGCGAVWAPTGQLVCFFIPKASEEANNEPKLNVFKFSEGGFSIEDQKDSSSSTSGESDDLDDDESDTHSVSDSVTSSEDSFTNDWDEILQNDIASRSRVPGMFKTSVGFGNRYITNNKTSLNRISNEGRSASNYMSSTHGETTGLKKKSKRHRKNKNTVGIFDFRHLIPDKFELACEYRVLGDLPENLARYNSQIAYKYGYQEIGDVWRMLEMILVKDVQVKDLGSLYRNPNDSQKVQAMNELILSSEVGRKITSSRNNYRFYWGAHPFGHTWLINEIIRYFEIRGNIQMLAMLSCILFENSSNIRTDPNELFNVPVNTPYHTLPPPSVIESKDYTDSEPSYSHDSFSDRHDSRPESHRDSSVSIAKRKMYPKSINSSIEFQSFTESPPDRSAFKRNIPLASSMGISSLETSFSLKGNESYGRPASFRNNIPSKRGSMVSRHPKGIQKKANGTKTKLRSAPVVTITMYNTETLDLYDDVYTSALLSSQDDERIKAYREQYAEMLYSWGLPINRIKILKFNYPNEEIHNTPYIDHEIKTGLRGRPKDYYKDIQPVSPLTTIQSSVRNAWNTVKRTQLKYCSFCDMEVVKRIMVCNSCEHVLHADCAVEWWTNEDGSENYDQECPSGCSCRCLEHNL